jgi:hypothetical protein
LTSCNLIHSDCDFPCKKERKKLKMMNFFKANPVVDKKQQVKNAKADEAAMMYMAKEISKKTHENEQQQRKQGDVAQGSETRQRTAQPARKGRSFRGRPNQQTTAAVDEYGIPLIQEEKNSATSRSKPQATATKQYDEYGIPLVDGGKQHHPPAQSQANQAYPGYPYGVQPQQQQQHPQAGYYPNYPNSPPYSPPPGGYPGGNYPQYPPGPGGGGYPNYPPAYGYPQDYQQYQQQQPQAENRSPLKQQAPQQQQQHHHQHQPQQSEQKKVSPTNYSQNQSQAQAHGQQALDDPAVRAFMEKRRLKHQQQKEQQLQEQIMQEAIRLNVEGKDALDPRKSPVPDMVQRILKSNDAASKRAAATKSPATDLPVSRKGAVEEQSSKPPTYKEAVPPPVSIPQQPTPQADSVVDSSHVLHPSNSIAFKAASALFQLARKHPTIANLPSDTTVIAATQLAGMWINQTAFYITKMDKTPSSVQPSPSAASMRSQNTTAAAFNNSNTNVPASSPPAQKLRKLSSKQSFRKEVIESMSAKLEGRIVRTSSQDKQSQLLRQSKSTSMMNVLEGIPTARTNSSNKNSSWICPQCTLRNKGNFLACEACGNTRGK